MAHLLSDILEEIGKRARSPHRLRAQRWAKRSAILALLLVAAAAVAAVIHLGKQDSAWATIGLVGVGLALWPALLLALVATPNIVEDWAESRFARKPAK